MPSISIYITMRLPTCRIQIDLIYKPNCSTLLDEIPLVALLVSTASRSQRASKCFFVLLAQGVDVTKVAAVIAVPSTGSCQFNLIGGSINQASANLLPMS